MEYLDHTADVLVHAWGDVLTDAIREGATAVARYMYPMSAGDGMSLEAEGSSGATYFLEANAMEINALVYNLFTELLVLMGVENVCPIDIRIVVLDLAGQSATAAVHPSTACRANSKPASDDQTAADRDEHTTLLYVRCCVVAVPVTSALSKGTEVKAITKQGMSIRLDEADALWHLMLVIDI